MSKEFITDSDTPAVQQVNNFISNFIYGNFVTAAVLREQGIKSRITCELYNKVSRDHVTWHNFHSSCSWLLASLIHACSYSLLLSLDVCSNCEYWDHLYGLILLANVNSRSRSLCEFTFAICYHPSVCLSVTLVRPTQAVQIFGNISTALGTLAIHWHPLKMSRRSSQGNPSAGGVKHKRGSQV